jgi:hypothetical protein
MTPKRHFEINWPLAWHSSQQAWSFLWFYFSYCLPLYSCGGFCLEFCLCRNSCRWLWKWGVPKCACGMVPSGIRLYWLPHPCSSPQCISELFLQVLFLQILLMCNLMYISQCHCVQVTIARITKFCPKNYYASSWFDTIFDTPRRVNSTFQMIKTNIKN